MSRETRQLSGLSPRLLVVLLVRCGLGDFSHQHQECDDALQLWIIEATCAGELAREFAGRVLTADETYCLHKQQAQSSCALVTYLGLRRDLHAELKGATKTPLVYGKLPDTLP